MSGNSSGYSVRVARPSDYKALAELLAELLGYSSDFSSSDSNIKIELVNALNTNLLRLLSTPGNTLLVAEEEGSSLAIGFISVYSYWGLLDDAPSALLDRIVVSKAYQATSVVAALLEQGIGACQAMGCSDIKFVPSEGSLMPKEILEKMGFQAHEQFFLLEIR